ncbi:MAG: methyl-accepting chemotaxis protein [Thermoleophilia bacterium]
MRGNGRGPGRIALGLQGKILGLAGLLIVLVGVVGALSLTSLGAVDAKGESIYADRVVPLRDLGEVRSLLGDIDSQIQRAITDADAANHEGYASTSAADESKIDELIAAYEATFLVEDEKTGLVAYHESWDQYRQAYATVLERAGAGDPAGATEAYFAAAAPLYGQVDGALADLVAVNDREAEVATHQISSTYSSSRLLILVVLGIAIVAGIVFGFLLARSIVRRVGILANRMQSLAGNCLTDLEAGLGAISQGDVSVAVVPVTTPAPVTGGDEVSALTATVNEMLVKAQGSIAAYNAMREEYLAAMVDAAQTIAVGDLSVEVAPRGADDALGNAFASMTGYLRGMAGAAGQIADGDLTVRVQPKSGADALGVSFASMVEYLRGMAAVADRIAQGDLSVEVEAKSEADALGVAFRNMTGELRTVVADLRNAADELAESSSAMAATAEQSGRAVEEIAAAVGEIAAGAERQARLVNEARSAAEEATDATGSALGVAREGESAAAGATEAMAQIREGSERVTATIRALGEKSEQIGGIVETITGIAEQTNLLALNAAIEAARAGDQGRGFAVVAEEVRKLAEESQEAAATISTLIQEIQGETWQAVEAVELTASQTADGVATVEQARESFLAIGGSVEAVAERVRAIAGSADEVASVAEGASASTEQVAASAQETSASTQEVSATAQQLNRTSEDLARIVGRFTVA